MNEVAPRRAGLVLGWAMVFARKYHLGSRYVTSQSKAKEVFDEGAGRSLYAN